MSTGAGRSGSGVPVRMGSASMPPADEPMATTSKGGRPESATVTPPPAHRAGTPPPPPTPTPIPRPPPQPRAGPPTFHTPKLPPPPPHPPADPRPPSAHPPAL